jgi:hypothetical protein
MQLKTISQPLTHHCIIICYLQLPMYEGKEWVGHRPISKDLPELSMLTFEAYEGAQQVTMV